MAIVPRNRGYGRMASRYHGGVYKAAWRAGAYLGKYIKRRWGSSGRGAQRVDTGGRNSGSTYGNLTNQYDTARIYTRKKAPRRVRRGAKWFISRLKWGLDKLQGMRMAMIAHTSTHTVVPTSDANAQGVVGLTIYGYGANTYAANVNHGNGDMWWIMSRENGADPTGANATRKLRFRSCAMNVNVVNRTTGENAQGGQVIVDVYHVLCKQNYTDDGLTGDPTVVWNESVNELSGTNLPSAITNANFEGVTPFDAGQFAKYYTVKSIRRYRLEADGYFNLQLRDPANYVLGMGDLLDTNHKKYITEGYMFVFYNPSRVGNIRGDATIELNYNKKYHYTETTLSTSQAGT